MGYILVVNDTYIQFIISSIYVQILLGIGHWALGIGHWALGIGHKKSTVNSQQSTVNSISEF
ncbi:MULTISPECIES: hypothetical protein [unclassified Calothrix]|uniref:hypothetical protein n=1 Tax=unclassified Calothrix TaxID=2619626 RepID=UPI0016873A41|nr:MULTISPECIES: hypothetical protein [unclassified Calothrix]MBD2202052.1 hypothetical protein [Calothrix sp. FACHB-168]